jgi:hypothetical protein
MASQAAATAWPSPIPGPIPAISATPAPSPHRPNIIPTASSTIFFFLLRLFPVPESDCFLPIPPSAVFVSRPGSRGPLPAPFLPGLPFFPGLLREGAADVQHRQHGEDERLHQPAEYVEVDAQDGRKADLQQGNVPDNNAANGYDQNQYGGYDQNQYGGYDQNQYGGYDQNQYGGYDQNQYGGYEQNQYGGDSVQY